MAVCSVCEKQLPPDYDWVDKIPTIAKKVVCFDCKQEITDQQRLEKDKAQIKELRKELDKKLCELEK